MASISVGLFLITSEHMELYEPEPNEQNLTENTRCLANDLHNSLIGITIRQLDAYSLYHLDSLIDDLFHRSLTQSIHHEQEEEQNQSTDHPFYTPAEQ